MVLVRRPGDLRGEPVIADQQTRQPSRDLIRDLVLVVGAADHRGHVFDDGGQGLPPTPDRLRAHRLLTVNVRWVTPEGVETASMLYASSSDSRPSQSRTPRPSTIGTYTTCM